MHDMIPAMLRFRLPLLALLSAVACAQVPSLKEVDSVYPEAHAFYLDLHQNPELSAHETETAAKLAARWRSAGYEVTEHIGVEHEPTSFVRGNPETITQSCSGRAVYLLTDEFQFVPVLIEFPK